MFALAVAANIVTNAIIGGASPVEQGPSLAHGPIPPPDPWDDLLAHGPIPPPDPWDDLGSVA
ncbi:MAG: hypothetical protein ACK5AZ_09270 [Bryobacteraceae bacterium]